MPLTLSVASDPPGLVTAGCVEELRRILARAAAVIERAGRWRFGEVSVLLVSVERISELHLQYFDDPDPTDIITFPYRDEAAKTVDGDIAICPDVVREQAAEAGMPFEQELAFVGVHGLLHLAGWDDATEEARAAMHARQDEILSEVLRAPGG